jgi:hypothetical protein
MLPQDTWSTQAIISEQQHSAMHVPVASVAKDEPLGVNGATGDAR